MKKACLIAVILFVFVNCHNLSAQQLSWKRYTVNDGLLQSQINTIFQDSKGYMWISSRLGISRFDGIHFDNFTEKDGLIGRWATQISEDPQGNIWLLFNDGLSRWDGKVFENFPFGSVNDDLFLKYFVPITADSVVIYQLSTKDVFKVINLSKAGFSISKEIQLPLPLHINRDLFDFTFDPVTQNLWFSDRNKQLYVFHAGVLSAPVSELEFLQGFQIGPDGSLYYVDNGSLFNLRNGKKKKLAQIAKPDFENIIYNLAIDSRKNIVLALNNQPIGKIITADAGNITDIVFPLTDYLSFDSEDNLWCGTETGLYQTNSLAILQYLPEKDGLYENIWSVVEGKNGIMYFASYYSGLQQFVNGDFSKVEGFPKWFDGQPVYLAMGSITDSSMNLYLTTDCYPAIKYDGISFTNILPLKKQIPSFIIRQSRYDKSFLIGAHKYFLRVHHDKLVDSLSVGPGNWKSSTVTGIEEDKYKRIWLGGFNGMSMLIGDSLIHFPTPDFPFEAGGNAMLRDQHDNLWIGNLDGLYLYDYESFTKIEDPLLDELVVTLITVGDSTLYIGTIKGIVLLDLKRFYDDQTIQLTAVGADKGFDAIEPGQNGFYKDSKGYLWLPTNDRVVRIDPALIHKNAHPPKVYVTDLYKLGDQMNWLKVENTDQNQPLVSFSHRDKNLRFEFIGISQRYPQGVNYSYMLEGYDAGWSVPSAERTAVYTNLPPGDYRFLVKASNSDGVWSITEAVKAFTIVPAIYQRLWFKILGIVLAMLVLFGSGVLVMYFLRRRQKLESENARKMSELRLLSIHNQIEPHFTYNAINTIAAAVLREERQTAYTFFVKLSKMMRSILQHNNQLTTTLEEELEFVNSYVQIQQYRFNNQFDFELLLDEEVDTQTIIPKMCIQTFTENAIKHGLLPKTDKGLLRVSIYNKDEDLIIEVEDDGIGRAKALELNTTGTSNGLRIIDGYFEHFNLFNSSKLTYQITDQYTDKQQATGTHVLIRIPGEFVFKRS